MIKRIIAFCILSLCLSFSTLYAQTTYNDRHPLILRSLQQNESGKGSIQVVQDKRIDDLIAKYIDNNPNKKTIPGFRIRIFSDSKQGADKRMRDAKTKFISNYPDIETYPDYHAPDWKIYVGNFRTQTDAFRMKKQIEPLFPDAFIVRADIDYSKL